MTPSIDNEVWLLERLRSHCAFAGDPFDGTTEPHERRERFRKAILAGMLQTVVCGGLRAGKPETYAQVFERLYGEPLESSPKKPTQGKPNES